MLDLGLRGRATETPVDRLGGPPGLGRTRARILPWNARLFIACDFGVAALESPPAPPILPAVPSIGHFSCRDAGSRCCRLLTSPAVSPTNQVLARVAMNIKPLYDRVVIKRMEEEKMRSKERREGKER